MTNELKDNQLKDKVENILKRVEFGLLSMETLKNYSNRTQRFSDDQITIYKTALNLIKCQELAAGLRAQGFDI